MNQEELLKHVNAQGYVFQLRVEHEISSIISPSIWKVVAREHRWEKSSIAREGFIDLILKSGNIMRMVIECKRVTNGIWLFLIPNENAKDISRNKLMWINKGEEGKDLCGWDEFIIVPNSMESSFCIVRGQGEDDSPMLERLCGNLLHSVESLAAEELNLISMAEAKIYIPVIITNAQLRVCYFDKGRINLEDGMLTEAKFDEVPLIRFRKNLSTGIRPKNNLKDLEELNNEFDRTVFIINSSSLSEILKEWQLGSDYPNRWPWQTTG